MRRPTLVHRSFRRVAVGAMITAPLCAPLPAAAAPRTLSALQHLASSRQLMSAYTPDEIATAYDFTPLYNAGTTGNGQTVALVETGKAQTSDLQQFDDQFNLPAPTIRQYFVNNKKYTTKVDPETTLDIEWLHALAPGATIAVYYLNINQVTKASWKAMGQAITQATNNGARTISISLGTCGTSSGYTALQNSLSAARQRGVSTFVASGDSGDLPGPRRDCGTRPGVSYPGSDPNVVSVGGTSLQLNDDNTISSETGWSLSGGGIASKLVRPNWQTALGIPSGTSRMVPDVSFVADPATGVAIFYKGEWQQTGGTSLGAPAWAAAWAMIRQSSGTTTLPSAPSLLYKVANSPAYATAFHDIVEGSNGQYSAGTGWDAVTGLGTPDVAKLAQAVQAQA